MRIVLHSINFLTYDGNYDIGTLLLRSALLASRPDVQVDIVQSDYFDDLDGVVRDLESRAPDILGFSVAIWSRDRIETLIERCAHMTPRPLIVCGGHGTRFVEREFLEANPGADIVVCGDGEITFREVVEQTLAHGDLGRIPGLVLRDGDGVHETREREEIVLLSEQLFPYETDTFRPPRMFGYLSQRYCPFHCKNCTWQFRNHPDNNRTLDQVREDLAWAVDNGYRDLRFWDSSLNLDSERLLGVLDLVDELGERLGFFWGYLKYELLSSAQIERLAAFRLGRLTAFNLAAESFAPDALRLINRNHDLDRFRTAVETLHERRPDFRIIVQMMLGLPGDDLDTFRRALDYLATIPNVLTNVNPLVVTPGTIFADRADELGMVFEERGVPFLRRSHDFSEYDLDRAYEHIEALSGHAMVHPLTVPTRAIENPERVPEPLRGAEAVAAGIDRITGGRVRIRGVYPDAMRGEAVTSSE